MPDNPVDLMLYLSMSYKRGRRGELPRPEGRGIKDKINQLRESVPQTP